jgi:hypothetical protein
VNSDPEVANKTVESVLPSGAKVLIRVEDAPSQLQSTGREGEGPDLQGVIKQIREVAQVFEEHLASLKLAKAQVEFGVSVSAKSGPLMAVIFEGKGSASMTVTLEWDKTGESGSPPEPPGT